MRPSERSLDELLMDIDRTSPLPLYSQVATRLEQAITSGVLPAGSRLETEVSLSQRLGLSRPTIRQAIQELVDKGMLVRRRGVGTQVVHGPVARRIELTSLYDDLVGSGRAPRTTVLTRAVVKADPSVAQALDIPAGDEVLRISRLRFADDVPMAILENYLPREFIGFTEEQLDSHGLYQLLRAQGVTIRVADQTIGARRSTVPESRLLEIRRNGPVLTMDRTAYDGSGRAVEVGHHCYRPDRYSFQMTLVDK